MKPDSLAIVLFPLIGARIRRYRSERGYTQQKIAKEVGLSRTSIVNIEKGKQRVPLHVLYLIASSLDIEPANLIPTLEDLKTPNESISLSDHVKGRDDLDKIEMQSLESIIERILKN